jgi:hypothetical protein
MQAFFKSRAELFADPVKVMSLEVESGSFVVQEHRKIEDLFIATGCQSWHTVFGKQFINNSQRENHVV